jgi:ABC-2 type transport system permease protein
MNLRQRLINPVLEKEFRLRMRTIRSAIALLSYLLAIGLLAFGFVYMMMPSGSGGFNPERSRELFYFLSGAQLVLISFMTPGLTAGVISGEREKQTLNMLLTTQQSSTTIILSKLVSSISYMVFIVFATMPIYSVVFLFGGISPGQVLAVFLFYLFIMIVLGSFGMLFSTIFKKTVVSVIVTYGFTLFIYGFTGLLAIFLTEVLRGQGAGQSFIPGYLLGLNPMGAMISIFDTDFSRSVFNQKSNLQLWHIFIPVYSVLSVSAILLSIRFLRPVLRKRK